MFAIESENHLPPIRRRAISLSKNDTPALISGKPVVLIKMVLIQHRYGIPSLRQTHQRIQDTLSYRWFLGCGLLDKIPHFATVSYAFCKRFPEDLSAEIFDHILNKALNNRMVDPTMIFIDGTHIKASAKKKKSRKEQVARTAKGSDPSLHKTKRQKRRIPRPWQ